MRHEVVHAACGGRRAVRQPLVQPRQPREAVLAAVEAVHRGGVNRQLRDPRGKAVRGRGGRRVQEHAHKAAGVEDARDVVGTGGTPAPDPLRRLPPSPSPPSLEIGWKVPDHERRRRPKEILLDLVQGEKMGFHPMCLYSKCSVFGGEPNSG